MKAAEKSDKPFDDTKLHEKVFDGAFAHEE